VIDDDNDPIENPLEYAQAALRGACDDVSAVTVGSGRNHALFAKVCKIGAMVTLGVLDEVDVVEAFGIADGGLQYPATRKTIESGLKTGKADSAAIGRLADRVERGAARKAARESSDDPLSPRFTTPATGAEHGPDDDREPGTTSWVPINIDTIVNGTYKPPVPEFLARRDGHRLFYRSKLNYLLGNSESGKTWLGLWAIAQTIAEGGRALFLDFEDDPVTAVHRLRRLGATGEHLGRFVYIHPDEPLQGQALDDFTEFLDSFAPSIVLIDSFNEAISIWGGSSNSNDDVPVFLRELPRRIIARCGACVVIIDHTRKNNASEVLGGIGAQAKRSGLDGAALLVKQVAPMAAGVKGKATLTVDKDRPGGVRAHAQGAKYAGTFVMDETVTDVLNVWVDGPDSEAKSFRYTAYMQRVSEYLELLGEPVSQRKLRQEVRGEEHRLAEAARTLAAEGYATVDNAGRYASHRAYREVDDPLSDKYRERDRHLRAVSGDD
jgi:hypothetical protein